MDHNNVRENWSDYEYIGEVRSENLSSEWSSPYEFVSECNENSPDNLPTYTVLSKNALERVDGVGDDLANKIINQLVWDLERENMKTTD